jgi:hypothetical protein
MISGRACDNPHNQSSGGLSGPQHATGLGFVEKSLRIMQFPQKTAVWEDALVLARKAEFPTIRPSSRPEWGSSFCCGQERTAQMNRIRFGTRLVLTFACSGLLLPNGLMWAAPPTIPHAASFSQSVQDVRLSADRSLAGIVVDVDGQPREGVRVLVASDGKAPQRVVTDSKGRFVVKEMRGGLVRITTDQGATLCRAWAAGTAPPSALSLATLVEMPDVVRGQFYGPSSQLLANPWVLAGILTAAITVTALAADRDSGS